VAFVHYVQDIFRKYPNRYESIIAELCENLDTLDEPEAKVGVILSAFVVSSSDSQASMIWIIGEYADRIDNAPQLLEGFVETFDDENPQVSNLLC
jgi:vesicle coat complex subunit